MKRLAAWTAGSISVVLLAWGVLATVDEPVNAQQPRAAANVVKAQLCVIKLKYVATLAAERPGIIEYIEPEEGDSVRAGATIVGLKNGVAKATYIKELEKTKNNVHIRYAEASYDVAKTDLNRGINANTSVPGTIPEIEIDKLNLAAKKANLQIEQAEFEQKIALLTLEENLEALKTYQVVAPFDGIVSKIHQRNGEAVQQGTPILEILSTSRVRIEGWVTILDAYKIKEGDDVVVWLDSSEFDLPSKNVKLRGKLKFVDPRFSELIQKVRIYAEVDNPEGILRPGLKAHMDIMPSRRIR